MFSAVPMPQFDWNRKNMRYALLAFPLIGVLIGLAFWGADLLCEWLALPAVLRGAVFCLIPFALTGGIHLDGYADTCDALASHADPEKKQEILKDPHVGSFAVMRICGTFLLMFALWAVFGLYLLSRLNRDAQGQILKRAIRYIGIFALTLAVCAGCRLIDRAAYRNAPEAAAYEKINDARSALTDYGFPKYEENKELFDSMGISYNAYKLFSKWNFYDPDVFTLDKMEKLIAVQNRKSVSLATLKEFLDVYPAKWFENPMFYCFLVLLAIALLHGRREWITYAEIAALILVLGGLSYYMYLQGRFNLQRVDNPVWLCASLILMYLISPSGFNLPVRYAWTFGLVVLALNQNTWRETWRHNTTKKAEKMAFSQNFIAGVSSDTEHLYLTKAGLYAVSPAYGPFSLVPVGASSNMAVLGGWPAGSMPYAATLKKYDVTNPYRDCIDNEKVYIIDNDINLTINYIREYYDMKATAVDAGMFDDENRMYRIVTEPSS